MLATSREPLGVPGESVWRIPPLAGADALDLLCDRARTAEPGFARVPGRRAGHGADLRPSRRPPARHRARRRPPSRSVASEVAARGRPVPPSHRRRPHRGGPPPHASSTIDWGYDLLDGRAGPCSDACPSSSAASTSLPPRRSGGLTPSTSSRGLVDRSWVAVEPRGRGTSRYRLIETIRQYRRREAVRRRRGLRHPPDPLRALSPTGPRRQRVRASYCYLDSGCPC